MREVSGVACLLLEATRFAKPGVSWRLAADIEIGLRGNPPLSDGRSKNPRAPDRSDRAVAGLRDHFQRTGTAGKNQVKNPKIALLQSVGGVGSTVITHLFGNG